MAEEPADFERWYRRVHPSLLRAVWGMCGDRELAADLVADAFSRALERWDEVASMAFPDAWVRTVATNCLRRRMRRVAIEQRLLGRPRSGVVSPEEVDVDLWRAIGALAGRQKEVIAFRYLAGLTEAEIARTLGVSEGAVSASLTKARRNLSVALSADEQEVGLP